MLGKDLRVYIDDSVVASCTSCELTWQCEVVEVSGDCVKGREYRRGRDNWRVSCSWLVTDSNFETNVIKVGDSVSLGFLSTVSGVGGFVGSAIVTECTVTGTRGSLATGRFSFQGNGDLIRR